MKIGYARVSTKDQNLDLQIDALRKVGCTDTYIYKEEISGVAKERPQLKRLLEQTRRRCCSDLEVRSTWPLPCRPRSTNERDSRQRCGITFFE